MLICMLILMNTLGHVALRVTVNKKLLVFVKTSSQKAHFSLLTTVQLPITTILLESSTFSVSENSFVAIFLLLRSYISFLSPVFGDLCDFIHDSCSKAVLLCKLPFVFLSKVFISALDSMDHKKDTNKNSTAVRSLYCYEMPILLLSGAEHCHKIEASEQTPLFFWTLTSLCAS